jgi:hypothetical protein
VPWHVFAVHGRVAILLPLILAACATGPLSADESTGETGDCPAPEGVLTEAPELDWTELWSPTQPEEVRAIAVDEAGDLVVVGARTLGPDLVEAFARKRDAEGAELWSRSWSAGPSTTLNALAVTVEDTLLVAGCTGGALEGQEHAGEDDAFVMALDPAGEPTWIRQWGSAGDDCVHGLALGPEGEILLAGRTTGDLHGAPLGGGDAFAARMSGDGTIEWATQWGSEQDERVADLALACTGETYVLGRSAGVFGDLPVDGGLKLFLSHLDAEGELGWTAGWDRGQVGVSGLTVLGGSAYVLATEPGDNFLGTEDVGYVLRFTAGELEREQIVGGTGYAIARGEDAVIVLVDRAGEYGLREVGPSGELGWAQTWGLAILDVPGDAALALGRAAELYVAGSSLSGDERVLSRLAAP